MKPQKTISIPTPTSKRSSTRRNNSSDDDDDDSDSLTFSRNRNYGPTSSSLNSSLFKNTLLNNREAYHQQQQQHQYKQPSLTTTTAPSIPNKTQQKANRSASITTNDRKPSPSLLQPPISSSLFTPNFLSTNNLKDSEKILLDFVQGYEKQKSLKSASSASNSSDKLSDDEDPYLILSSSFNQGGWEQTYSKIEEEILESPTITDQGNYSQSFHSISEISKNKQNKRNWFRFMKIESDSLEDCSDDEESSAPQVDKKEILLLFLLQHAATQLNPDMGFFVSLCKHLTHLGYFSNRMTDESFIKTLCKDFMEDITNIFPVSSLELEENRGIVRSESYSSYLSDISHSPNANREFLGGLESSPVIDSMFYNAKRLESDYHHFQKLGKEKPYSSVIKAIHKIDGRAYAIKKVKFHFSNTFELEHVYSYVVNEIKNLAKLDNENIIRYNSAWFEPYRDNSLPSPCENLSNLCSNPECGSPIWSDSYVNSLNIENDLENESLDSKGKKTDVEFEFTPKRKQEIPPSPPPSMSYFEFALKRGKETSKRKSESMDSDTQDITSSVKSMLHEMFNVNNHFEMVLYIVMQLCEGTTMENWLSQSEKKKNRKTNLIDILKIFKRIVKGVCHIHERGLVHKNLKPNNIFIASNNRIKIADFGVAKYLQECLLNHKKCKNKEPSPNRKRSHTFSEQGSLYASPEQIFNQKFDQKGDIYSLGVILFELISPPFVTTTERVHVLSQLKKREISEEILKSFPREIEIIKQCLDKPNNRPTAQELLQKVTRLIKSYKIEGRVSSSGLKHTNSSSSLQFPSYDTIREKNRIIEEQQRQIELLKEQLRNTNNTSH